MARKKVYDRDAIVPLICARLATGEPMAQICRDEGMPERTVVWDWAQEDDSIAQHIAHARERGEEALLDQCLEIADDGRNDYMAKLNAEGEVVGETFNAEHVQRSKLRVDTRLKLLAKWNPKKWGELVKQEHSGPDGGAIEIKGVKRTIHRVGDSDR